MKIKKFSRIALTSLDDTIKMKKALIAGITGQDGSYLAEFLLKKGYQVHGIIRRSSLGNTKRLDHVVQNQTLDERNLMLHYGDITDSSRLEKLVGNIRPDEVYNLAAQSHVQVSFNEPIYTADVVACGALKILEAVRSNLGRETVRFYQATSCEIFGNSKISPQNEETPLHPDNPYACGKVFAFHNVRLYRDAYGLHASNGILFNHESPRRGETFVTRKITRGLAQILAGKEEKLFLGNLDAKRDWGHARDYVEAMWLMLQQPLGGDYVIATGESKTVKNFLEVAFGLVDLNWQDYVEIDPKLIRPVDVDSFIGDSSRARTMLGWSPRTSFLELTREMVIRDLQEEGLSPDRYGLKI